MSGAKVYSIGFDFGLQSDYIFDFLTEDVNKVVDFIVVYPV